MRENRLSKTIKNLIRSGKEGNYWDFKEKYHDDNVTLIHDILCLSNCHYDGDRYIIYGVRDSDKEIVGIDKGTITQSNLIDLLRGSNFSNNIFPDILLEEISVKNKDDQEKNISVIIIKNKPSNRPYYLEKMKRNAKSTIPAGAIYTRIGDTNTPINEVASSYDTEKMWCQRFGLDFTPLERITQYLRNFKGWGIPIKDFEGKDFTDYSLFGLLKKNKIVHYKQHSEFAIRLSPLYGHDEDGLGDKVEHGESWVRHALDPNSSMYKLELMYHQTVLHTEEALTYDAELFNNPRTYFELKNFDGAVFYYYMESDSLQFNILRFLHPDVIDHTSKIVNPRRGNELPIIIFKNHEELEQFCDYFDSTFSLDEIKNIKFNKDPSYDWNENSRDILNIQLCLFIKEQLPKWRNNHDCT